MIAIDRLDHLVLTVADIERTCAFYADVLGMPLYTTRFPEATMLGSAVVAAVGAGAYPDLVQASQAMVEISGEYQPNMQRHAEYGFFMRSYQETYQQLKGLMQAMTKRVTNA